MVTAVKTSTLTYLLVIGGVEKPPGPIAEVKWLCSFHVLHVAEI
jgi:hypothetical protein